VTLEPFVIERFGSLNVVDDPTEFGAAGAVDLLDVDLDGGRVRCRDGYAKFTSSALGARIQSIAATPNGGYVAAWADTTPVTYYTIDRTGAVVASAALGGSEAPMFLPLSFSEIIATTNRAAGRYVAGSEIGWAEVDISGSVTGAGTWNVVFRLPVSNRIAFTGNGNRVQFSETDGTTFTTTSWVDLDPNDGDFIIGAAVYRDLAIVFKQRRFYVFGRESVDSDGGAVFDYRPVDTRIGLAARFGTAPAPEGVYFISRDGIYLTSGDAPRKVSAALDPLFRNLAPSTFASGSISQQYLSNASMVYHKGRLYASVTMGASTTNNRVLVYDPRLDVWTVWSLAATSLASLRVIDPSAGVNTSQELMFAYATGTNDIGRHFPSYTTDAGSAIAWSYKSGKYSPAKPGRVAVTSESSLVGTGTVTLRLDSDLYSNQSASATLGVSPTPAEGWPSPVDQEGTWLQYTLSGSGVATVDRLTHLVSAVKPAGVR
jgi:hypothetical protein